MSNDSSPSPRRLTIAISAAAVSMTLAVGVTAGSLLGWFRPASEVTAPPPPEVQPPAPAAPTPTSPVILVPVAPEQPVAPAPAPLPSIEELAADSQVAFHEDDDHERREHEGRKHQRHEREDEDDDD